MVQGHFCEQHQSKYYKNEKADKMGQMSIWYSHKMIDGQGFCVEKNTENKESLLPFGAKQSVIKPAQDTNPASSQGMLMCNAMNNAVSLAANGRIQVDQIGAYYQRILSELMRSIQ
jgi:hypothetical protein